MDIKAGATDQRIPLRVVDASGAVDSLVNTDFTSLYYLRPGGAKVPITPVAGSLEDAHSDGKVAEIGNGWYELHAPDAAFAADVPWVIFGGTVSSGELFADKVDLIGQATTGPVGAYALQQADTGPTAVFRTGADGDTGETLSDQMDAIDPLDETETQAAAAAAIADALEADPTLNKLDSMIGEAS